MKFEYKKNLYQSETIIILILSALIGLPIMYYFNKYMGLTITLIGMTLSVLINIFSIKRSYFKFEINDTQMVITYAGRNITFAWEDVVSVKEDERGLIFKINRGDLEFPILNDMDDYDKFKNQVMNKAYEYRIQLQLI